MNKNHYGLHVDKRGNVTLSGRRYTGFGLNYFGAFAHYWHRPLDKALFKDAFAKIKTYGIDYIRMPFCGGSANYFSRWDSDPGGVYAHLDAVVAAAEELHLGIIAGLCWSCSAIPEHLGGHRSDYGDPESETSVYSLRYIREIVSRYADSPAVWGWEIGNEYNLEADLCDGRNWSWLPQYVKSPTGFDYMTSKEMLVFFSLAAGTIREIDPWRMISSGHGDMRPEAASLAAAAENVNEMTHIWSTRWEEQSRSDFERMNGYMSPEPIDALSFHLSHGTGDGSERYIESFERFGDILSQKEYLSAYAETAGRLGRTVFLGEMGDYRDLRGEAETAGHFRDLCEDIRGAGIPLACARLFQNFNESEMNGSFMAILGETNDDIKASMKINIDKAWPRDKKKKAAETLPAENKKKGSKAGAAAGLVLAAAAIGTAAIALMNGAGRRRR